MTIIIGEEFKNPAMAAPPSPHAVTLKNMFDESTAHLPSPGPALRKSVEQRLGLKTSTGGVSACFGGNHFVLLTRRTEDEGRL